MTETHLTDEQLDRMRAGVEAQTAWTSHLAACGDCQARLRQWASACPTPGAALANELAARRASALRQGRARRAHWHYPALAATLAALTLGLWVFLPSVPTINVAQQEHAETVPDVYADLEFYLWLSKQSGEEQGEANSS